MTPAAIDRSEIYFMKTKYKPGQSFNRWTLIGPCSVVLSESGARSHVWDAICSCGVEKKVFLQNVVSGRSKSCGCLRSEVSQKINLRHGQSKAATTKTYKIWASMKRRCQNKNEVHFKDYGGRGITVCDKWQTFEGFFDDMGECPEGHSIERLDVNGKYEKSNCKWMPQHLQSRNTRANKLTLEKAEEIRRLASVGEKPKQIANSFGVDVSMVHKVVRNESWRRYEGNRD